MKSPFVINKLDKKYVDKLISLCEPRIYNTESEIIYEGHVPTAGYLLVEGEIHFLKKKRVVQTVHGDSIFGVTELMNNNPIKYTVRIQPNSKVCILDRSTIKELLNEFKEELPGLFQELVA